MIVDNLSTLKINKMTQEQYDRELAADNISTTELYLTPAPENMDYIIESGHYGTGWYYRKWKNGTYECWGRIRSVITAVNSLLGGSVCYGSVSFPTTFIETPVVNYTIYGNSGYEFCGKSSITQGSFTWYALSNATYAVNNVMTVTTHVIGRWK